MFVISTQWNGLNVDSISRSASAKERQWEEMQHRQKQHHEVMFHADPRVQQSVRPPGNLEQHMLQSGFSMSDVKGETF